MGKEHEILERSRAYAESKGFQLNKDEKILKMVVASLAKNESEKGRPYCPCRPLESNPAEDEKKVCPCAWHIEELERDGHCKCMLFFRKG